MYVFDKESVERIRNTVNIVENMPLPVNSISRRHKQAVSSETPPITLSYDSDTEIFTVTCNYWYQMHRISSLTGIYKFQETSVFTFEKPTDSAQRIVELFYIPGHWGNEVASEYKPLELFWTTYTYPAVGADAFTIDRYREFNFNKFPTIAYAGIYSNGTANLSSSYLPGHNTGSPIVTLDADMSNVGRESYSDSTRYYYNTLYGQLLIPVSTTGAVYLNFNYGDSPEVYGAGTLSLSSGGDYYYELAHIKTNSAGKLQYLRLLKPLVSIRGITATFDPTAITSMTFTNGVLTAYS